MSHKHPVNRQLIDGQSRADRAVGGTQVHGFVGTTHVVDVRGLG